MSVTTGTKWVDGTISVALECRSFSYTLHERFNDRVKVSHFWRRQRAFEALAEAWENIEEMLCILDDGCDGTAPPDFVEQPPSPQQL